MLALVAGKFRDKIGNTVEVLGFVKEPLKNIGDKLIEVVVTSLVRIGAGYHEYLSVITVDGGKRVFDGIEYLGHIAENDFHSYRVDAFIKIEFEVCRAVVERIGLPIARIGEAKVVCFAEGEFAVNVYLAGNIYTGIIALL